MKTKKTILLILGILWMFGAKTFAQGTNCSNSIILSGNGTHTDFAFQPKINVAWFSFTATSARMQIGITKLVSAVDTPFAHIDSLILYAGTCMGMKQLRYSVKKDTNLYDSLPVIQILSLTPGQTYYVKVTTHLAAGSENKSYFGLKQSYLAAAIKPSCTEAICGPNLLCNGDFETPPTWATPSGIPITYQDNSDTYHANISGSPVNSYCISSPDMRYSSNFTGQSPTCASGSSLDKTDIYNIGTTMGNSLFNNAPHSGSWFMGIDCPSDECSQCSSTGSGGTCPGNILNTSVPALYTCIAWQQTVTVTPGTMYAFNFWIRDMDVSAANPGAPVAMEINGAAPFFQDVIDNAGYGTWQQICYNWTAPVGVTHANIQIFGTGDFYETGDDFELDDISFGTASASALPAITLSPAGICPGGHVTLTPVPTISGVSSQWSNGGNTGSITVSPTTTTTYSVTVTENGCQQSAATTVTVSHPTATFTTTATCIGMCTGKATVTGTGGVAPYTYHWSTGPTTASVTNLCAGTHTVTVTDANGCTGTVTVHIFAVGPPIINVPSPTICKGSSTTLCATGTASPGTYIWDSFNYSSCISVSPSVTTTYSVVGNNGSCTSTATATVTVAQPPLICLASSTEICPGSCITLDGVCKKNPQPGVAYNWSPPTYIMGNSGAASVTACPETNITYTLTATDYTTNCISTATETVTLYTIPTITMSATPTCRGLCTGSATVTVTSGTGPFTYNWTGTGQTAATATDLCAGSYTVTVTDAHGCTVSGVVRVPVDLPPFIHVSSTTICQGTNGTICASGSAVNYVWNTGVLSSCITVNPSVTTTYTVTGSNGICSTTATGTVFVNPSPAICLPETTTVICPKTCVDLDASCGETTQPIYYTWSPGTGLNTTAGSSVIACPASNTIYHVTATNTFTGCSATGVATVDIFPGSFTINGPTTVECGSNVTYTVSPVLFPPIMYNWTSTGNPSSGTGTSATVSFNSPGGTISWTITDPLGCTRQVSENVTCETNPIINNPIVKGIDGSSSYNNIVVFPNPAGDILNIQMRLRQNEQVNICMYNSIGEVIKCETLKNDLSAISTTLLPSGIYYYRITNADGTLIKADKVMIAH